MCPFCIPALPGPPARSFLPQSRKLSLPYALIRENPRKSAAYNLPYILPSSVCSKSLVFTLFTKLPGCTQTIPKMERAASRVFAYFPFSLFHFPRRNSGKECRYISDPRESAQIRGFLHLLCFQTLAHSLLTMARCKLFPINRLRTLSHSTGGALGFLHTSQKATNHDDDFTPFNFQPSTVNLFRSPLPHFLHSSPKLPTRQNALLPLK